jgi:hypothetical protein
MTFGDAISLLKAGHRVARKGWNGKGMWLAHPMAATASILDNDTGVHVTLAPFILMHAADGSFVPWLASQTDVLAEDWVKVLA